MQVFFGELCKKCTYVCMYTIGIPSKKRKVERKGKAEKAIENAMSSFIKYLVSLVFKVIVTGRIVLGVVLLLRWPHHLSQHLK